MILKASLLFILSILILINGQNVSDSLNEFSLNLLATTNSEAGDNLNVALSPFTIWTLLTIVSEGAQGNSLRQLANVLKLNNNIKQVRNNYLTIHNSLLKTADGVHLEFSSAIFTNKKYNLRDSYQKNIKEFYKVNVIPTDFRNTKSAVDDINGYISRNTNNRIKYLVNDDDVRDAYIFLTSVLSFKGEWESPFNRTATKPEAFYDEKGAKIGDVQMMYQNGYFPYTRVEAIRSYALELPYGNNGKMSMIVLLPFKGSYLANSLNLLSKFTFNKLLDYLEDAEEKFIDEEVQVYLPRFKVTSEFNLDRVLNKMGIKDIFNSQEADLLGILDQYLYISRVLQKADIEVDEEGTIAAAAAGASFAYKSPPPKFQANRPFMYFLVDKPTRSIVFAGKVSYPNSL